MTARMIGAFLAYITFAAILVMAGLLWGRDIEAHISPVLKDQVVSDVVRKDNTVCWTWTYEKAKFAKAKDSQFSYYSRGVQVGPPPVPYVEGTSELFTKTETATPHHGRLRLCVKIPMSLQETKESLVIEGAGRYQGATRLWDIWQPYASIPIPPP